MTLQERIEDDLKHALKNREAQKLSILRVLMVEITKKDKIASDEEVVKCVKKQIESAKLCHTEEEIPFLQVYLPEELSDEKMITIIVLVMKTLHVSKNEMGKLMPLLKEALGPDFDGKRVSAILKTL